MANTMRGSKPTPSPIAVWIVAALLALGAVSACTLFYDADPGDPPADAGSDTADGTGDGTR